MIGLDTNVVVRYLVQDDPDQSPVASAVIDALTETNPGYVSVVTVVEIYWVLRRAYQVGTGRCAEVLEGLLDARELRVDQDGLRVDQDGMCERPLSPAGGASTSPTRSSPNSAGLLAATVR